MTVRTRLIPAAALAAVSLGILIGCSQESTGEDPTLGGVTASATVGQSIDGTYTVTYTEDDYVAAGLKDQALIDENVGRFTWTLDDGSWSYVQESPSAGRLDESGAYELADNELTFRWQNATITMDVEKHDDGSLVFTNVVDPAYQALSEVQFGLHPWVPVD